MSNQSFTHYYVQAQKENELPVIVSHTYDKKKKEHFHKFLDRKKAEEFAKKEKEMAPNDKFRVVKCVETFSASSWF